MAEPYQMVTSLARGAAVVFEPKSFRDSDPDGPHKIDKRVAGMQQAAKLGQALMGGTEAMRDAGTNYLPIHPAEDKKAWAARKGQSFLFPAFELAVDSLASLVFRRPIQVTDDVPAMFLPEEDEGSGGWLQDVDLEGRSLDQFGKDVMVAGIVSGLTAILADYPNAPVGMTVRDEDRENVRPYLTHIPLPAWLGYRTERRLGTLRLTMFRWKELEDYPTGSFGCETRELVRILEAPTADEVDGRVTLDTYAKQNDTANEALWIQQGPSIVLEPFEHLPLSFFFTDRQGFLAAQPAMQSMAEKNLEHWQSASDQRNILHVARVPLLMVSGVKPEALKKLVTGPTTFYALEAPDANMKFVEHTGSSIDAGWKDLDRLKDELAVLGMRPMVDAPRGGEMPTATGESIRATRADTRLQAWAIQLEDALEDALGNMASWIDEETGGGIVVNKDFGLARQEIEKFKAAMLARADGDLSRQTLLDLMRQSLDMPEGWSVDEEIDRLAQEAEDAELLAPDVMPADVEELEEFGDEGGEPDA